MKMSLPHLVIPIALALVAPGAAATWFVHGSHEPDNQLDHPTFMFFEPPAPGERKIYFNVVEGIGPGLRGLHISPNVALVKSAHTTPAMETFTGIFGVWIDCNGDDYIGLGETGAREYPASLLLDTSACPPTTGPTNEWVAGAHNYNGWVSELIPIGGTTTAFTNDSYELRVYRDPEAMIWGDPGKPDDPASVGGSCPLAPQPRGTYQSTGGFLNYVGCFTGLLNRWNEALDGRRLGGQDVPGLIDLGVPAEGYRFAGGSARGSWADVQTFGSEDTQYSPLHVWDCDADPAFHSGDFYNATTAGTPAAGRLPAGYQNINVYAISPQVGNINERPIPAFVNDTQEGLEDCDTSNDNGHDFYGNNYVFYVGETDFAPVSGANKTAAQWNFQFQDWGRGGNPLGFTNLLDEEEIEDGVSTPAVPWPESPIFGGGSGMAAPYGEFSNWNPGSVTTTPGVGVAAPWNNRHTRVNLETLDASLAPALYFTFYAHIGSATAAHLFSTPGGSGTYGATQCGLSTSGILNGWNCDKKLWYHNPDGSPQPEPTPLARIGQSYQFRDVDCYDGRFGTTGVAIGTPAYGADPCVGR